MNVLSWNCRGTTGRGFPTLIKDLKKRYDVSLLFLLETHVNGERAKKIVKRLGFLGSHIVDSRGRAGGIWCLWDPSIWSVVVLHSSDQVVHLKVGRGKLEG